MRSTARTKLLKALRERRDPCWVCGGAIDYGAVRTPASFTGDEIIPRSRGGNPLDPGNVRAAHLSCNSRRGGRLAANARYRSRSSSSPGPAVAAAPKDRGAW